MSSSSSTHPSSNTTSTSNEKKQTDQQKLDVAYKIWKAYMDRLDKELPQPRPMEEFMKYLTPFQKIINSLTDPAVEREGLKRIAELCEQNINIAADKQISQNNNLASCLDAANASYRVLVFLHGQTQYLPKLTGKFLARGLDSQLQEIFVAYFEEIKNLLILKFLGKSHTKPVSYAECFHFELEGRKPYRRETVVRNLFVRLEKTLITDQNSQITPLGFLEQLAIELTTIFKTESNGYADDSEVTYIATFRFINLLEYFLKYSTNSQTYQDLKAKSNLSDFFEIADNLEKWKEKHKNDYLQEPAKTVISDEKSEKKSASSSESIELKTFQTAHSAWKQYPSSVEKWDAILTAAEAVKDMAIKISCLTLIAKEYEANKPPYSYYEYFSSSKTNADKALEVREQISTLTQEISSSQSQSPRLTAAPQILFPSSTSATVVPSNTSTSENQLRRRRKMGSNLDL